MAIALDNPLVDPVLSITKERGDLVQILQIPSVRQMALLLSDIGVSDVHIRMALTTLVRFSREVADGNLSDLLKKGQQNLKVAESSISSISQFHTHVSRSQIASLAFGPKLWWRCAGVNIQWNELSGHKESNQPLPQKTIDQDTRLLILSIIGSGASLNELASVTIEHAGSLSSSGEIIPDLNAEPLAISYLSSESFARRITFLSFEAREALLAKDKFDSNRSPSEALLLPKDRFEKAALRVAGTAQALIKAGNDVNVSLCRATGDFFRTWGMPGARFEMNEPSQA